MKNIYYKCIIFNFTQFSLVACLLTCWPAAILKINFSSTTFFLPPTLIRQLFIFGICSWFDRSFLRSLTKPLTFDQMCEQTKFFLFFLEFIYYCRICLCCCTHDRTHIHTHVQREVETALEAATNPYSLRRPLASMAWQASACWRFFFFVVVAFMFMFHLLAVCFVGNQSNVGWIE